MAPRLQYVGFSFARPPSTSWFIDRREEKPSLVLVRHVPLAGEYHTAFVSFSVSKADLPADPAGFAEWMKKNNTGIDTLLEIRSYEQETVALQGQTCVSSKSDYDVRSDRYPSVDLRMISHTISCIHPGFEKAIVETMYSERGLPDEVGTDPVLAAEGEQIMRGFEIDVAEGVPAK